jgi:TonB family protein
MTSTTARPNSFQQPPRDPNMAALLSVIPGLGQLYNGETRKGALFLAAGAINFSIFILFVFTDPILRALYDFGVANHMKPNRELVMSIHQAHMGSPASIVVLGLFLSFMAYAVRDAYDRATLIQRRHIYPEYVLEMPEATSGSYIFHFATMVSCFVLAFFFLVPPPPARQVTDIEFIQNQPPTQKKIISHRRATHASEASGKHEPKKEITPPSPAPKAPSKASHETPKPIAHPQPVPQPVAHPVPIAHPTPHPSPQPSPHPTPTHAPSPSPTPKTLAFKPSAIPTPFFHPFAAPSLVPSAAPAPTSAPAPSPVSASSGLPGGGPPSPSPIAGGGSPNRGGGTGPAPAPSPSRAGRSGGPGGGGPLAVAPSVPRSSSSGGQSGEGIKGNPDANNNPGGRPSVAAQADIDFGPYMADLQRRIKRAWFPPKGDESKRVVVVFKIHKGGDLSHLRLEHSSGLALADQAALKAVENAAPFRPLPAGASDDVDIQFTFDYNVFSGRGRSGIRRF